jgi:hypothetical protein
LALPEDQREELEPLLQIADDLARVRNVFPAPAFADDLEARLRQRVSRQATAVLDADDDEHAPDYAPTVPALGAISGRVGQSAPRHGRAHRRISWQVWSSLAAAVLLALTVTTFTLAASASPGSVFYAVRRGLESARTNLTNSDAERTKLHIQYASDALNALDIAVAQHDSNAYGEALGRFTDELQQASSALTAVPAGNDHDTLGGSLDDLRARARRDLRAALASLSWPSRIATTSALGDVGETVVIVKQVSGVRSGASGARTWTVTITGSGFQNGAVLLVRGRPAGHVLSITPTQLTAQLSGGEDDALAHGVGVGNPDGTAAATTQEPETHDNSGPRATGTPGNDNHGSGGCSGEREDHSVSCTPTPGGGPTPSPSP